MALANHERMRCFSAITLSWILLAALPLACSGSGDSKQESADGGAAGSPAALPDGAGAAGLSAGDGGQDAGATSDGGATHGIPTCESPTDDASSQLVVCANGFAHRAQPSVCGREQSAGNGGAPADDGQSNAGVGGEFRYGTACTDDRDCVAGSACVCNPADFAIYESFIRPGKGICVLATCRTDADCAPNSYCAVGNLNFSGEAEPGFGCLRDDDECTTNADCDTANGDICFEEGRRTCSQPPE